MSVKTVLVDLLEWRGLTQSQLAKGLGITKGKISLIVNGKANPNKSEEAKLEEYFDQPISQLLESMEA